MEKLLNSGILRNRIFTLLLFIVQFQAAAQDSLTLIGSRTIPEPVSCSIDRAGQLYITYQNGEIVRYNSAGEENMVHSPEKIGEATLLDAWQGLVIFAFYRDYQEYIYLDRFLRPSSQYTLDPDLVGFASMAAPSGDNNLWIIDDADLTLKKMDIGAQRILINLPLNTLLDGMENRIVFMREYQNMLFLVDGDSGILVFDNLGNYNKQFGKPGLNYVTFQGNNLYWIEDNVLVEQNLYKDSARKIQLPENKKYRWIMRSTDRVYMLTESQLEIYEF